MLKIHNLSFAINGKPLFDSASASIPMGHKVGIVGRNGAGKTSLFRLIRKKWDADGGQIEVPAEFRIGGVDQEVPDSDLSLLYTVLAADHERQQLLAEADTATDADCLGEIHARLIDIDAYSGEARAASILSGLGLIKRHRHGHAMNFLVAGACGWRWPRCYLHNLICYCLMSQRTI